ncbi:MAG TPA: DUF349 domain-containing protein [Candidatus Polarisedimenticolia bacterium]|nr:DUF349 domain-containing protein [Candidatus Polarisedimenticolia bacterium]
MGLLDHIRPHPGWKDPDPKSRRAAVRTLADPALLIEIAGTDGDPEVREEASQALLRLALEGEEEAGGLAALASLVDKKQIVAVARGAAHESVSRAALLRLSDLKAFGSVARHGRHVGVRLEALKRIRDRGELGAVALRGAHDDSALAALERLAAPAEAPDRNAADPPLEEISRPEALTRDLDLFREAAEHAKSPAVARRARAILHEREAAAGIAPRPRPATDRRAQTRLCDAVEALAKSTECEPLKAGLAAAQDAWIVLLPNVDDDLHERFTAACRVARERLARNLAQRAERLRREEERALQSAQHLAPRLALCAAVETANGAEAPRLLEESRWAWERLSPPDAAVTGEIAAEVEALARRFEAAATACGERHEQWEKEAAAALARAETAAEEEERSRQRQEDTARRRDNLKRLQKLCDRADRLLQDTDLTLKKAEPALHEIRAALDTLPPLPSRRDHDALVERLKGLQAALAPRFKELREADRWKRWANTNVQEDLCLRLEALRDAVDPRQAVRQLTEIQDLWKTAGAASKDRSQALWQRFTAARDVVLERLAAYHAGEATRKQALCEQAEALAPSNDWVRTAEAIKRLQAEWKTIGPAGRGQEKALWGRFRKACDQFFSRRDEDLGRRKDEWAKNLAAREALCERAEALSSSTDWAGTAAEIKRLQAEWKTIGPVRKNRSEAIWQRFKVACDGFFERYKRRDELDLEITLAAREALLREVEALVPAVPGAPSGEILEALKAVRRRWIEAGAVAGERGAALEERFDEALGRIVAAFPEAFGGTDFDAAATRRRMEELCTRLERLLPQGASQAEEAISPAMRLATQWREAMAANTIGGKAAEEGKWRAAAEEMKKAQAAWQRLGYLPASERRALRERFEAVCRSLGHECERRLPAQAAPRGQGREGRGRPDRPQGRGTARGRERALGGSEAGGAGATRRR